MREASNQIFLLDQIYSKTGLKVDVVDMPQEIYTKFVAIRNTLKSEKISSEREGMLMMDISSGGLGVTLVQDDQIRYQENFHVGIIRIKESFARNRRESIHFNKALTEFLSSTIGSVRQELHQDSVQYLVLSGTETELLLRMLGLDEEQLVHRIKADDFHSFFAKMRRMNLPQLISAYKIPEHVAELALPTVLLYEQLLHLLPAQEIVITGDSFIDGMQLLHIGRKTNPILCKEWDQKQSILRIKQIRDEHARQSLAVADYAVLKKFITRAVCYVITERIQKRADGFTHLRLLVLPYQVIYKVRISAAECFYQI